MLIDNCDKNEKAGWQRTGQIQPFNNSTGSDYFTALFIDL